MAKTVNRVGRWTRTFVGGCLLFGASIVPAYAAPPAPEKLLEYRPRQEVNITTPAAAEVASCKVDLEKGRTGGSAWVLKDAGGNLLRRFASSTGGAVDAYSYFKDGVEVYREVVPAGGRTIEYRWLNAGGSKWGVDEDRDGKIDTWKQISVEEVSQEVLRALVTKDLNRLHALMITEADLRELGLPADVADAIRAKRREAKAKFEGTIAKLAKLGDKSNWVHVETHAPEQVTTEASGAKVDYLRHTRATVLFETGGSSDWFQLGQLIQVGGAWKLLDAPIPGAVPEAVERPGGIGGPMTIDPAAQKLLTALGELDKVNPGSTGPAAVKHHLDRSDLLEKIIGVVKPADRDPWIRQLGDSLSSAAQADGKPSGDGLKRLTSLEKQMTTFAPGGNLAGYVTYRRLQAEYAITLSSAKAPEFADVQKGWMEKLTGFVKAYPKADDTPDAMLQLGMVCEFLGKEVEAKNWYGQLARAFPGKPQAAKGEGAVRRLGLEGEAIQLVGPTLNDSATTFDASQLRGKVVIVYYWASWNGQAASDFAKLKSIVEKSEKQVEVVGINLDGTAKEAKDFADRHGAPGTHLFTPGGLDSKLAAQYGIMVLPSVFVVGKDGKVLNKAGQISTVEDEVKKHLSRK